MTTTTRRTQAERSARTRGKLISAAVQVIANEGVAGATTRRVCEVADVSQGAMTHHFPSRIDLLVETFDHLTHERVEHYSSLADLPPELGPRLQVVLHLFWDDLSSTSYLVVMKLLVAASDDPELRERLAPVEKALRQRIAEIGREFFAEAEITSRAAERIQQLGLDASDVDTLVSFLVSTITGIAITNAFDPSGRPRRTPGRRQRELLERLLAF